MADSKTNRATRPLPVGDAAGAADAATRRKGRKSRIPRGVRWTLGIFLLAVLAVGGIGAYLVYNFQNKIYKPLPDLPTETPTAVPTLGAPIPTPRPGEPTWTPAPVPPTAEPTEALPPGRINVLVLGTDKRTELQEDSARSDTLIIFSIDPQWKTAGILSIPRDLQVPVPGYGLQKINAAYFFGEYYHLPGGGPTLAVPTVSKFFNVPIQYYVEINFDGFQKIIDMIGGIDLYVPEEIDDPDYPGPYNSVIHVHFNPGCQHMDGVTALQYARTRHADSDFGRSRRQQQVIKAVRERVLQLNMLPTYGALLDQLGNTIQTNIPPDKQWVFAQLAGQIQTNDIYSAQIDNTMVRQIASNGNLDLRWDKAKPLLDWFFGRGRYASLKPGTVLTPVPTATAEVAGPLSTTEPVQSLLVPGENGGVVDPFATVTETVLAGGAPTAEAAVPDGKCP